jgi:hypothetical protein
MAILLHFTKKMVKNIIVISQQLPRYRIKITTQKIHVRNILVSHEIIVKIDSPRFLANINMR